VYYSAGIVPASNFSGRGTVPVGTMRGISAYGTYDMAGNVREWCSERQRQRALDAWAVVGTVEPSSSRRYTQAERSLPLAFRHHSRTFPAMS